MAKGTANGPIFFAVGDELLQRREKPSERSGDGSGGRRRQEAAARLLYVIRTVRWVLLLCVCVADCGGGGADVKVKELTPGTHGHNLVLQVVSVATAVEKQRYDGTTSRIAEAVLADETGCVTFTARNGTRCVFMSRWQPMLWMI